jgi:hypothetical protein
MLLVLPSLDYPKLVRKFTTVELGNLSSWLQGEPRINRLDLPKNLFMG